MDIDTEELNSNLSDLRERVDALTDFTMRAAEVLAEANGMDGAAFVKKIKDEAMVTITTTEELYGNRNPRRKHAGND